MILHIIFSETCSANDERQHGRVTVCVIDSFALQVSERMMFFPTPAAPARQSDCVRAALPHSRGRVRARAGTLELPCVSAPAYNADTDMATKTHTATHNEPLRDVGLNIPETRVL